jgi:hypothetical protein
MHHAFSIAYCLWCNSHYYCQGILLNSIIVHYSSLSYVNFLYFWNSWTNLLWSLLMHLLMNLSNGDIKTVSFFSMVCFGKASLKEEDKK